MTRNLPRDRSPSPVSTLGLVLTVLPLLAFAMWYVHGYGYEAWLPFGDHVAPSRIADGALPVMLGGWGLVAALSLLPGAALLWWMRRRPGRLRAFAWILLAVYCGYFVGAQNAMPGLTVGLWKLEVDQAVARTGEPPESATERYAVRRRVIDELIEEQQISWLWLVLPFAAAGWSLVGVGRGRVAEPVDESMLSPATE